MRRALTNTCRVPFRTVPMTRANNQAQTAKLADKAAVVQYYLQTANITGNIQSQRQFK